MNDIFQWYEILGVSRTASPKTIKEAYRELAQLWHPDRYVDDPELKARAEEEIKEINQAYSEIKAYLSAKINGTNNADPETKKQPNIKKTQNTPEFYYQQGVNLAEEQSYDDALTSFAQAIKLNPDYLEAYQYRGFILSKLGFNLRADAEFKRAHQIKLKSRFKQPQSVAGYSNQQLDNSAQTSIKTQTSMPLQCWQTILATDRPCNNLTITQGGDIAGSNGTREILLWQANTGQPIGRLQGHSDRVSCLTLSPSGQTLISGSKDQTIKFWDIKKQKLMQTLAGEFDGHLSEITTLAISPDNKILLSCDLDNSLKIWDVNYAKVIKNISFSADVTSLAIHPNGQLFCSGGLEPQIRIRQIKDGQVIRSINNQSGVLSLAFSPDGKFLATGGFNRTLRLWDITTGREIYTLTGHSDRISKVIFSRDGQTLISSSWDKTIRLWELSTGKEITCIKAHANQINTMAIALNNQTLVSSSSDRTIKLWHCNF
ncbi:MAG: DnaJ domain-containing protein [Cyanobacteria bacterium P01_E01_bin.35]